MTIKYLTRTIFIALLSCFITSCSISRYLPGYVPVKTAKHVDLHRYAGQWYEIAAIPTLFQQHCLCSKSTYYRDHQGHIIANVRCRLHDPSSPVTIKERKVEVVKGSHGAKFKIEILWPFRADYWILYVDPDYQYTLAGTPNRKYIWILSRKPTMPKKVYNKLVNIAKEEDYPIKYLKRTSQICYKKSG